MACNGAGIVVYGTLLLLVAGSCGQLLNLKSLEDSRSNSTADRGRVTDLHLYRGRLVIGQNSSSWKRLPAANAGYQADMGWMQPPETGAGFSEQRPSDVTMERILKMEPRVECSADSMKLKVQNPAATPGSLFLIDRGRQLSALPLSKLPSSCGYTVKSTQQDLVVVAPYDGCFVTQEEDNYVLPMLWLGLSVRMLCPQVRPCSSKPPTVTCYAEGMVVKMEWPLSEIYVNVRGSWQPLMKASQQCGFGVVEHSEGVVVSVDYRFCLQKNDGMYTLEVSGDRKSVISCPISGPQPDWTDEMEDPGKGGYGDPQPPSKVPPTSSDPLYPQPVPEQPTPPALEDPWGYFFPERFSEIPGAPEGPGQLPFDPPPEPTDHPAGPAVGKPGAPQGKEEYPPVVPVQPQTPEPDLPQSSLYWPFFHYPYPYQRPQTPPLHPSKPEQVPGKQPDAPPQVPGPPPVYPTTPPQPGQKPVVPQVPGYPPVFPMYPPHPGQKPVVPQIPGYPPVYPTTPPQPGQKPETPPGKEYTPFYPSYPQPHPETQPEGLKPAQKPHLPQTPPGKPGQQKQPVGGPFPPLVYGFNYPKYIPHVTPPPTLVGQDPTVPRGGGGGVATPQSSLGMPPLYCICPSGFGNCCPQFAFHQHHHHIVPVAPGSRDVPPIYTGLPFVPLVAFPGLDDGSGSPAPQTPNEPTSTLAPSPPPDSKKQPYLQPPDGSHGATPGGLPGQAHAYMDPQGVGQYWSYLPLSGGQASGEDAGNPAAQHHPYVAQPPKGQSQSPPWNVNYASAPHFLGPPPQQHAAKQQPRSGSEARAWSPYVMLQDAQEQTQNTSALSRSPPASRSANKHHQLVNATSESNSYLLLQRGPPGKAPPLSSEAPSALRRPVHHGRDQGPSDRSPEKFRPSREKAEAPGWLRRTPTSFPNFWTRTISKRKVEPGALQKAFPQWGSAAEQKPKD